MCGPLYARRDIARNTKKMHLHYTYAHFILHNTTREDTPIRPPVCSCVCVCVIVCGCLSVCICSIDNQMSSAL